MIKLKDLLSEAVNSSLVKKMEKAVLKGKDVVVYDKKGKKYSMQSAFDGGKGVAVTDYLGSERTYQELPMSKVKKIVIEGKLTETTLSKMLSKMIKEPEGSIKKFMKKTGHMESGLLDFVEKLTRNNSSKRKQHIKVLKSAIKGDKKAEKHIEKTLYGEGKLTEKIKDKKLQKAIDDLEKSINKFGSHPSVKRNMKIVAGLVIPIRTKLAKMEKQLGEGKLRETIREIIKEQMDEAITGSDRKILFILVREIVRNLKSKIKNFDVNNKSHLNRVGSSILAIIRAMTYSPDNVNYKNFKKYFPKNFNSKLIQKKLKQFHSQNDKVQVTLVTQAIKNELGAGVKEGKLSEQKLMKILLNKKDMSKLQKAMKKYPFKSLPKFKQKGSDIELNVPKKEYNKAVEFLMKNKLNPRG